MQTAVQPLAAQIAEVDRRRTGREEVALDTLMANREAETFAARILNLSASGFMAQTEAALCERAPIRIDIPTIGWLRAEIVWVLGDRVGASFLSPIEPRQFATFVTVFGASPRG